MQNSSYNITIFLIITTFLIMLMGVFILTILFLHRKKQTLYQEKIKEIEANYERNLLRTQLEIQEQTFQNISREIHDNISLSLTLAKLNLHTLDWNNQEKVAEKIDISINLLTNSIAELRDISKSLNSQIIIQHGLLKAMEEEIQTIRQAGLFVIKFELNGTPVYMNNQNELIIFRIVQEAFNNIIKHAEAKTVELTFHYNTENLAIQIRDDGKGFDTELGCTHRNAGLKNMEMRVKLLQGNMDISSWPGNGTILSFKIPFR